MLNSIGDINNVIIRKGEGVISAIRKAIPNLTKGEVFSMANSACARLKGEIPKDDICPVVQPGQVIQLPTSEKIKTPTEIVDKSGLIAGVGMIQKIDENGKKSYQYTTTSGMQTFPKG